jgi:hypothetical protein
VLLERITRTTHHGFGLKVLFPLQVSLRKHEVAACSISHFAKELSKTSFRQRMIEELQVAIFPSFRVAPKKVKSDKVSRFVYAKPPFAGQQQVAD